MPSPYTLKMDRYASHALIAERIRKKARANTGPPPVVLDVGCSSGFLRAFLPRPDYYLMGIERDQADAAQASSLYDEVYCLDIASPTAFPVKRRPSVIVFGDILEHLPEPAQGLQRILANHAKHGTQVIISLPNIAHLYVRWSLLFGRFEYAERGILDRTHLRFFTLKTAREMCSQGRVRIDSVTATPVPLPTLNPIFAEGQALFPLHQLNAAMARLFKTWLGYQFILDGPYEPGNA